MLILRTGHFLLSPFLQGLLGGLSKMQFYHAHVVVHYINKCGSMCANIACAVY